MMQLPEMLMLLGRWSGVLGLICALIGIVLEVGVLLKENPILAFAISLSVIGLVVALLNLTAKKPQNYWKFRSGGGSR